MGKKQTYTKGPEEELIDRVRQAREPSEPGPNYGPLGVDQNAIPNEQYNGVQRMDIRQTPLNNPLQPGTPVSAPDLAAGQQRAGTPGYQLDPNYNPRTGQQGGGDGQMRQTGTIGNGQVRESRTAAGDPLFVATHAVPTFEIDRQIGDVRKQKAELTDWISKQGEQFKGKAADPYQPAYEQYAGKEQNKLVKDVADTYFGGNMDRAWQGIHDDPELRAQWDRNNRYLASIGQANRGGYDAYEKIDQAVTDGKLELHPDTRAELEDALNAKWSFNGDTPAHSAWKFDQLNEKLSVDKLFNDYFRPSMDKAGDMMVGNNRVITQGGRKFLATDTKEDYDQFVDQFVRQAKKDGPWRNEGELRQYVESMVGRADKETWKPLPVGKSGGGSKGGASGGDSKIRLSAERTKEGGGTEEVAVKIFGTTSGSPSIMRPLYFNKVTGVRRKDGEIVGETRNDRVSAIPVSFKLDKDGGLILDAKQTKEPGTSATGGDDRDADSEAPMTEKQFNELPNVTFRGDAINPALEAIAHDKGLFTPAGLADVDAAKEIVMAGIRERSGTQPKKAAATDRPKKVPKYNLATDSFE